jgi:hypothetical protein
LINWRLLLWSDHQHLLSVLYILRSLFKTSVELRLKNLALRYQLGVLPSVVAKAAETDPRRSNVVGVVMSCLE